MKQAAGVLDIDRVQQIIHRRCEDHGVGVKWVEGGIPATSHEMGRKTITLPVPHPPITHKDLQLMYGFVIHETGHHKRPEAFDIVNNLNDSKKQVPDALFALFNAAEDDSMERMVSAEYRGDAIALGKMNQLLIDDIAAASKSIDWDAIRAAKGGTLETRDFAPQVTTALGCLSRSEWDGWSHSSTARYLDTLPPEAKQLIKELKDEGWVDELVKYKLPHECWDYACDLFKRLFPEAPEDQVEECRQQGHEGGGDDDGDNSSDNPQQGAGSESGDQPNGQTANGAIPSGDDEGENSLQSISEGTTMSWKEANLSEHDEWKPKQPGQLPGNIGITWEDYSKGDAVALMPPHLVNVIDYNSPSERRKQAYEQNGWYGWVNASSFMSDNSGSRQFGNQIRRYLQSKQRTKVTKEKYHGRIDKGSMIRLAMPPVDGGEWNRRIFYDYEEKREMNTCIHVLTDWSGSMSGSKMEYAADASGRLVWCFDRVLKVPVQLAAFTNGRTRCDIGLIKKFSDRSISPEQIATNFAKFYEYTSANNDADAVMWAYRQLLPRKEQRKILIVLSDGAPAGCWKGSSHKNLTHVTREIEKEGKIELYGVGICSEAVKNYYTNYKVLNDESEINKTLFEIIKAGAYK